MKSLWSDEEARGKDDLALRVYTSRLIGAEPNLVMWGGGNTSVKTKETDHRGRPVDVLRVKGSGSDLKTIEPKHFSPVRMDDVLALEPRNAMSDEEMVAYLRAAMTDPEAARPSIETLLHAFLPHKFIDHTHADSILSLTNQASGEALVREVLGDGVICVPFIQPGFHLSKVTLEAYRKNPDARAIVLLKHGLITFGGTAKESYDRTIEYVTRAEEFIARGLKTRNPFTPAGVPALPPDERRALAAQVAPALRGAVSKLKRSILLFDDSPEVMEFVNSKELHSLSQIGPATPDHVIRTKGLPLAVRVSSVRDAASIRAEIAAQAEEFSGRYTAYFERQRQGGARRHDPYPRVILVPGLGMWTTGENVKSAGIARDLYVHTISVIKGGAAIGEYASISEKEVYDMEYWPMELYKLTLAPPEAALSRRVALVTGAASGIGRAICFKLAREGAHVVATDLKEDSVRDLAGEINGTFGPGRASFARMDVTDEASVAAAFQAAALAYGGVDVVVSNAGLAHVEGIDSLGIGDWKKCLDVNATGHFLVSREGFRLMKSQGVGGAFVFVSSKNVFSPGKEFAAYSASKAAEHQLAKVLALEAADHGIRVNMVNPDGIFEGSALWSKDVRESRAKSYGIAESEIEEFYRKRNMLKVRIYAEDVAETIFFLASDASAKTTGCTVTVDGGVKDAFPR